MEIILNFIMILFQESNKKKRIKLNLKSNINNYSFYVNCTTYDMSTYTIEEDKFVHTCDLSGLSSDTTYYFNPQIKYDFNNV